MNLNNLISHKSGKTKDKKSFTVRLECIINIFLTQFKIYQ